MPSVPRVPVVTAERARELDASTIATLDSSFVLMHRAAAAACSWLGAQPWRSAAVYVGTGNNGGDGWLIAAMLREIGWHITIHAAGDPRTPDASQAKRHAESHGSFAPPVGTEAVVIDALLGTGALGPPRGAIADALRAMRGQLDHMCTVVAIDIPSGLDATTGDDHGALAAHHTLTFGSIKRGQLLKRDVVGELHVLDIGLLHTGADQTYLVDRADVSQRVPRISPQSYKGTRGRVAIVGGDVGMAGAVTLAARGAHLAGAGMVRAHVHSDSALALQIGAPFATVQTLGDADWSALDVEWPDVLVIGPGLDGHDPRVRNQTLELLRRFRGPVVLDAGALTAFQWRDESSIAETDVGDGTESRPLDALRNALGGRPALLTPHIGEFNRLFATHSSPHDRFEAPRLLAAQLHATVLLKGVPTIIAAPDGTTCVTATGNQALAMGGSGDLLAGIAGALLGQGMTALDAGAASAWVHGTAAEFAVLQHGGWRGVAMEALLQQVANVWPALVVDRVSQSPLLLELPAVPCQ